MSILAEIVLGNEVERLRTTLATMTEQKEYFRQCWEAAEAALLDSQQPCVWTHDGVYWSGQCGVQESRPGRYCQECGHPTKIEVQP